MTFTCLRVRAASCHFVTHHLECLLLAQVVWPNRASCSLAVHPSRSVPLFAFPPSSHPSSPCHVDCLFGRSLCSSQLARCPHPFSTEHCCSSSHHRDRTTTCRITLSICLSQPVSSNFNLLTVRTRYHTATRQFIGRIIAHRQTSQNKEQARDHTAQRKSTPTDSPQDRTSFYASMMCSWRFSLANFIRTSRRSCFTSPCACCACCAQPASFHQPRFQPQFWAPCAHKRQVWQSAPYVFHDDHFCFVQQTGMIAHRSWVRAGADPAPKHEVSVHCAPASPRAPRCACTSQGHQDCTHQVLPQTRFELWSCSGSLRLSTIKSCSAFNISSSDECRNCAWIGSAHHVLGVSALKKCSC